MSVTPQTRPVQAWVLFSSWRWHQRQGDAPCFCSLLIALWFLPRACLDISPSWSGQPFPTPEPRRCTDPALFVQQPTTHRARTDTAMESPIILPNMSFLLSDPSLVPHHGNDHQYQGYQGQQEINEGGRFIEVDDDVVSPLWHAPGHQSSGSVWLEPNRWLGGRICRIMTRHTRVLGMCTADKGECL